MTDIKQLVSYMITNNQLAKRVSGGNLDDLIYAAFRERIRECFDRNSKTSGALFTTDADVWVAYIQSFPDGPTRRHHDCRTCQRFLTQYGGLAVIGPHGELRSAVWDGLEPDDTHHEAVYAMNRAVRKSQITGVFVTEHSDLGTRVTDRWAHPSLKAPGYAVNKKGSLFTASQQIAEKSQDYSNVAYALWEYQPELLDKAVDLLESDQLYRAEHVLGPARWLKDLAHAVKKGNSTNLIWKAVATAPAGFCHPRSSMIGTLLEDLRAGTSTEVAAAKFRAKMSPTKYQRPVALPAEGAIRAAEDLVEKLGIAPSLERRFARLDEVEAVWSPPVSEPEPETVFGELRKQIRQVAKNQGFGIDQSPAFSAIDARQQGMRNNFKDNFGYPPKYVYVPTSVTWTKFARDYLPGAQSMEVMVPRFGNFCALVTAVHADSPPILQWDSSDRRNPVSWYLYDRPSNSKQWNLTEGQWTTVDAVCLQPSMWHGGFEHQGKSAVFVIHGARDTRSKGTGLALFPEILQAELHGCRSVIEAFSKSRDLAGDDEATACGIMAKEGSAVTVRVTQKSGVTTVYAVDRWE